MSEFEEYLRESLAEGLRRKLDGDFDGEKAAPTDGELAALGLLPEGPDA